MKARISLAWGIYVRGGERGQGLIPYLGRSPPKSSRNEAWENDYARQGRSSLVEGTRRYIIIHIYAFDVRAYASHACAAVCDVKEGNKTIGC